MRHLENRIYLDNAATTQIDNRVIDEMVKAMKTYFGNPSSTHSYGRQVKAKIEMVRKQIAQQFNISTSEIIFTSGGTEANNLMIRSCVRDLGIKHIITSPLEHHAVKTTTERMKEEYGVKLDFVKLLEKGQIDLQDLENKLKSSVDKKLGCFMQANNEVGNLTDVNAVGELCEKYNALYHSDSVPTIGHLHHNLGNTKVNSVSCSAHKFHGPKGVGFLYVNKNTRLKSIIIGGGQERSLRGGTENFIGIVGMGKALEVTYENLDKDIEYIQGIKQYFIDLLLRDIPNVKFNGCSKDAENSLYTILNVAFPPIEKMGMLQFAFDINGIAVSQGSACSSGASTSSHVLSAIDEMPQEYMSIRFSFSKYNTKEEIDRVMEVIRDFYR